MIIRDDEKKIFKVASILIGAAILLIVLFLIFPRSGYAATPLAGEDGNHNHVTFGDVYFDGYSRVEFPSDGYYNGYTFTGVTSGANVYEIQPGKLRHVSEMVADLGNIDEEIDNLVKEARYLAGTKVPVYGFDGKSVIGEFIIDIR